MVYPRKEILIKRVNFHYLLVGFKLAHMKLTYIVFNKQLDSGPVPKVA